MAVDLDDVLAATNEKVAEMHNEMYGTKMDLEDFDYYLWWRNKYWGTVAQTVKKVEAIYAAGLFDRIEPVDGAQESCSALKTVGYRLIIITARSEEARKLDTQKWIERYFPNVFDEIWFSGEFVALHQALTRTTDSKRPDKGPVMRCGKTKSEILRETGARLLIDDSLENAIELARHDPPLRTILFGAYKWNRRESRSITKEDKLGYDERQGLGLKMEQDFDLDTLGGYVQRAKNWVQVVALLA